jgi:hypothetical protein
VLGQLPDALEDDWIDTVLKDRSALQRFSQRVDMACCQSQLRYWFGLRAASRSPRYRNRRKSLSITTDTILAQRSSLGINPDQARSVNKLVGQAWLGAQRSRSGP